MKQFLLFLVLATLFVSRSGNGFAQMNVDPDSGEWFVKVGSVAFNEDSLVLEVGFDISKLRINTCRSLTLRPILHTCNEQKVLEGIMLTGKNRTQILERSRILSNGTDSICSDSTIRIVPVATLMNKEQSEVILHYRTSVPYQPWMKGCRVTLVQTFRECAGRIRTAYTPLDIDFK